MGGPHRPIIISITGQREKVTERERKREKREGGEKKRKRAYAVMKERREEGGGKGEVEGFRSEEHIGDADSRICRPEN